MLAFPFCHTHSLSITFVILFAPLIFHLTHPYHPLPSFDLTHRPPHHSPHRNTHHSSHYYTMNAQYPHDMLLLCQLYLYFTPHNPQSFCILIWLHLNSQT